MLIFKYRNVGFIMSVKRKSPEEYNLHINIALDSDGKPYAESITSPNGIIQNKLLIKLKNDINSTNISQYFYSKVNCKKETKFKSFIDKHKLGNIHELNIVEYIEIQVPLKMVPPNRPNQTIFSVGIYKNEILPYHNNPSKYKLPKHCRKRPRIVPIDGCVSGESEAKKPRAAKKETRPRARIEHTATAAGDGYAPSFKDQEVGDDGETKETGEDWRIIEQLLADGSTHPSSPTRSDRGASSPISHTRDLQNQVKGKPGGHARN
ncbi:MAG: hypothetical protein AAF195_04360 [Pseudomonadota bacterium]